MTTICWRDDVIASDSQFSDGNIASKGKKLFRLGKLAIGFAGDVSDGYQLVEFLKSKDEEEEPPKLSDDFEAIAMNMKTGKCVYFDKQLIQVPIADKFTAIGTGSELAIGAMEYGASAVEAVKIAILRDINSGGRVAVIRVNVCESFS